MVISKKQTGAAERVRYNTTAGAALSSGAQVLMQGQNGGVRFGAHEPRSGSLGAIIRGYWTDAQDRPITEAIVGDDVRFHIETRGIRNGELLWYGLYDDDRLVVEGEDREDDHFALQDKVTRRPRLNQPVAAGKVVIALTLSNLEGAVRAEEDKTLELYFRVSYGSQNVDLPRITDEYLKVISLPIFIDRYKIPGLNETGDEIAGDMAHGYGTKRVGGVYAGTPELAAYNTAYREDGFSAERDALFSNARDFEPIPNVRPAPSPPTDRPVVPQDNTRVALPDTVAMENARINALNRSRKAVYDREEMYRAAYRIPIPGTDRHLPISTGFDIRVFDNLSDDTLFWDFEQTSSLYFARGELQGNLSRLIAKFRRNEGGVYEDAVMTAAADANERTAEFCRAVERDIADRINTAAGRISRIEDATIHFNRRARGYNNIAYNNDRTGGLTIATNDIWAHEVSLIEYKRQGERYTAKYEIILWDHFGLDLPDMEKLFNILPSAGEAFVTWFILQHLRGYKPFLTKIRIERTFEGTINRSSR